MDIAPIGSTYETIEFLPGTIELDMTAADIEPLYIGYYQDDDKSNYEGIYSTEKDPEFICYKDDNTSTLYVNEGEQQPVTIELGNIDETGTYKQVTKITVKDDTTFTTRVYLKRGDTLSSDYFLIKKTGNTNAPLNVPTVTPDGISLHIDYTQLALYTEVNGMTNPILPYEYMNVTFCTNIKDHKPSSAAAVYSVKFDYNTAGYDGIIYIDKEEVYDYFFIEYVNIDPGSVLGGITPSVWKSHSFKIQLVKDNNGGAITTYNTSEIYSNIIYNGNKLTLQLHNNDRFNSTKGFAPIEYNNIQKLHMMLENVITYS